MMDDSYSRYFSKHAFFRKLRNLTGKLLEKAILLYLIMTEKETPLSVKLLVIAALGYFVCPFDAIPDCLPFGFTDDLTVMTALLASLDGYVTDEMRKKAKAYIT